MNIQKVENATAAYWARRKAQGQARIMSECLNMIKNLYGVDAVPVARDYIVKNICNIVETRKTWNDDMVDSLREYWARDPYEVPADVQSQFAPAINDRSNKD